MPESVLIRGICHQQRVDRKALLRGVELWSGSGCDGKDVGIGQRSAGVDVLPAFNKPELLSPSCRAYTQASDLASTGAQSLTKCQCGYDWAGWARTRKEVAQSSPKVVNVDIRPVSVVKRPISAERHELVRSIAVCPRHCATPGPIDHELAIHIELDLHRAQEHVMSDVRLACQRHQGHLRTGRVQCRWSRQRPAPCAAS
eukprot:116530-Rhodomonas_salina.4